MFEIFSSTVRHRGVPGARKFHLRRMLTEVGARSHWRNSHPVIQGL